MYEQRKNVTPRRDLKDHLSKSLSCFDEESEAQRRKDPARVTAPLTNLTPYSCGTETQVVGCKPGEV